MDRKVIAAQGEVRVYKISSFPEGMETAHTEKNSRGDHIISHSEKGHHHVLPGNATVLERTDNIPVGMRFFYAILDEPGSLTQDAVDCHESVDLAPDIYEFRTARQFNSLTQQASRVAD